MSNTADAHQHRPSVLTALRARFGSAIAVLRGQLTRRSRQRRQRDQVEDRQVDEFLTAMRGARRPPPS